MRNFVWSDDEVQKLATNYVCVTEECFDLDPPKWLEWVSNPDSTQLFLKYKRNAPNLIPNGSPTAQGTYCMTADGTYLAGDFSLSNRDGTLQTLRKGWSKFQDLAKEKGWQPQAIPNDAIETSLGEAPEPGGIKFHIFSRDLPRGDDEHPGQNRNEQTAWNQNWLDLKPDQAASLVNLTPTPQPVAQAVLEHLGMQAFKDNVRGQNGWKKGAFKSGSLTVHLAGQKGSRALLQYRGQVHMEQEGSSYAPSIVGRAIYDTAKQVFTQFEMLGVGQRTGASGGNRRQNDPGPAPMGIVLELDEGSGNPSRVGRTPRI
ncbi:MAG: hypothetical protein ACI9TH_004956 [Kiritimatiellia bacterium]|jgi:hypothetical protein